MDAGGAWHALYVCPKTGKQILYNVHTKEKHYLPEGQHKLHVTSDGNAYLSTQSGTEWCDDLLQLCVFQHPSEAVLWVEERSGKKLPLSVYQQRYEYASVPFKLPNVATEIHVATYVLQQSVGGTRVLFSLQAWHQHLLGAFTKLTFSRWLSSWWPWWQKSLQLHSMQQQHLRKAKSIGKPSENPLECFEEVTISLPAALALFSKWAGQSKGKTKDTQAQQAWLAGLQSLVNKFLPSQGTKHTFVFFLDTSVTGQLGLPLKGSNRIFCELAGGNLDIYPILLCDVLPVKHAIASSKCDLLPGMDLVSLLVELQNGGRKMLWLFNQLLHNVAECLQESMLEYLAGARKSASSTASAVSVEGDFLESKAAGRAQRRVQRHSKHVIWKPIMPMRRKVLKYFLCFRDHVRAEGSSVKLAFDASRVGGKSILLGFCTSGSSGFWLPPQVRSGKKKLTSSIFSVGETF
eukprot:1325547-Amphidinium_carterae.4